jgi:hypothetical protein
MGQSTIARCIANERGVDFREVDSGWLEGQDDTTFVTILTNLSDGQVLHMKNVELLQTAKRELLRQAMSEYKLTLPKATRVAMAGVHPLSLFTLVATCSSETECPASLVDEFLLKLILQPYSENELHVIARQIGVGLGVSLDAGASAILAGCCDGKPGRLRLLLKRLNETIKKPTLTELDVSQAMATLRSEVQADSGMFEFLGIFRLSGIEFEEWISRLLSRMGFVPQLTAATGDGGVDVIATLNRPIVGGRYLFQCKRYGPGNIVGSPAVRDFFGAVMADKAVKGIFITTSDFSVQAREFAEKAGIELIDGKELRRLLIEYGLTKQDGRFSEAKITVVHPADVDRRGRG